MTGLPPDWRTVRLTDVADTSLGKMLDAARPKGSIPTPYLRNINVQWGSVDLSDVKSVSLSEDERTRFALRRGDLLVCEGGEPGRAALWSGAAQDMTYQKALHRVRSNGQLEPRWLRYYLEYASRTGALAALMTGSTIKHLPQAALRQLQFPLPDLEEQRRILDLLETYLSNLDAAVAEVERLRHGIETFVRSAIDSVFRITAAREGWQNGTLEQLAVPGLGSITDGPFGSNLTSAHYTDRGALVVRLQNIGDGVFRPAAAYISLEHFGTLRRHEVRKGDVVVASLGEALPRAARIPDVGGAAIVKADCIRVRPISNDHGRWLVYACRSSTAKSWSAARLHGVGRQRLGMEGIRNVPVPIPHISEMRRQCNLLDQQTAQAAEFSSQLARAIHNASSLRRSLLTAAFGGRLTAGEGPVLAHV